MKKRISALLLSLVLCFSLVGTTFAREILDDEGNIYEEKEPTKPEPKPEPSTRDDDDDDDRGYQVSTPGRTPGGKVQVRPGSASQGSKVTVTVTPDAGYELDTLTVKDAKGNVITLTDAGGGTYTFIMPASRVTVSATFKRAAAGGSFTDVPAAHAFYGDISWAAARGYMGGYTDGTFRPSANTTRQALWMVLARIDGAAPADMAAARAWATQNGVSDGSNPGGAMTRQQMVTMLYRYAQSKGYKTTGGVSLENFQDASGVAGYARDAMGWAVGNGIVQGTGDGALNPGGTATRAHFAAFLHRFCDGADIA